ncbi:hypothetical protein COEREDRAFT_79820 [Coemansia reversa NRRL 1564]|uniref:PIG-F-domain-containing protein n=1 Tax=Coemansia reversa (strain ATCC 12441 / NRRL 1564) TaxID=763665 RepID=A0A2G5BH82_COERN|nr:hypothetical protein COEREDRAFT_79820 [Coemansia reversa NRRL 1564]|eukprot:PIA18332.1 hypothetical protein COEREDRAFT_79820 [Coemansia reversa NRRL 1564]
MAPEKIATLTRDRRPSHKQYPLLPNGIELMLGGFANSLALVSPRKSLNLYDTPVKYLLVSASVLFGYYAILTFGDIYCFKIRDRASRKRSIVTRIKKVINMGLATILAAVIIAIGFVLFGAPIASKHAETFMAALNVALLAVTPATLTLKANVDSWQRALLSAENKTVSEKWAAGFFWLTMGFTWMSAYFIPLDWDRPWQKWPIPIVFGAFLGNMTSLLYVLIRCFVLPVARADFRDSERLRLPTTGSSDIASTGRLNSKKDK